VLNLLPDLLSHDDSAEKKERRESDGYAPSMLSTSNSDLITLISRANCTVCTVELLPEPWKARSVGLTPVPLPLYVIFES